MPLIPQGARAVVIRWPLEGTIYPNGNQRPRRGQAFHGDWFRLSLVFSQVTGEATQDLPCTPEVAGSDHTAPTLPQLQGCRSPAEN